MILHQQLAQPTTGPLLPWLALHVESLTLAAVIPHKDGFLHIHPVNTVNPITPAIESSPLPEDPLHAAKLTEASILKENPATRTKLVPTPSSLASSVLQSSVYLLVNSLDGTTPGILHLGDPTALYLSEKNTAILQPTEHFRSAVDLSVEGWTYWWEDAQRAFLKLTIEFAQAVGTPVPEHIAETARHY